ncbi:hypothetical protein, partial [Catenovulum sediminis]
VAGDVTDTGTLTVSGTTDIDTAASNGNITLNTNEHSLNTLQVDAGTGTVLVDEADALTLQVDGAGDVTVDAGGALTLNAGSMSNLTADAASITDAGALTVSGEITADTSADNGNIDLSNNVHTVATVTANAGTGTVNIQEADGLNLGDTTASSLTVTTSGAVADSGTLTISGNTTIDTSAANGNVDLDTNTHSLNTLIVNAGTGTVDVDEADGLNLGNITAASLTASVAGDVTDTGTLTVSGTTDIDTAASNGNITLNTNEHSLNTLQVDAGTG